jgi:hypothetical protein
MPGPRINDLSCMGYCLMGTQRKLKLQFQVKFTPVVPLSDAERTLRRLRFKLGLHARASDQEQHQDQGHMGKQMIGLIGQPILYEKHLNARMQSFIACCRLVSLADTPLAKSGLFSLLLLNRMPRQQINLEPYRDEIIALYHHGISSMQSFIACCRLVSLADTPLAKSGLNGSLLDLDIIPDDNRR